jgi:hypothetical protein
MNVDSSGALTLDNVLSERFKEFAMEGMAWYRFRLAYITGILQKHLPY